MSDEINCWDSNLTSAMTCCVILGKLPHLSVSAVKVAISEGCLEDHMRMNIKCEHSACTS